MDFILVPTHPERQLALPEVPGPCPRCGAAGWRCNGTFPRTLVALGRFRVQRWPCRHCLASVSSRPPGVTSRQHTDAFRHRVAQLYVHCSSHRDMARILDLVRDRSHNPVAGRAGDGPGSGTRAASPPARS